MNKKILTLCALTAALAACKEEPAHATDKDPQDALAAGNSISCTVDGATTLSATGNDVSIASFGTTATMASLGVGLRAETQGKVHVISSGLMSLPIAAGRYHFPPLDTAGGSGGDYRIRNTKEEPLETYNGSYYNQFYGTQENDPAAKLVIDITRFQQQASTIPGSQRLSVAGTFRFNAAHVAYVNGNLPDACSMEAITRSMKSIGGAISYPRYDPAICGAKKHRIECKFDITQDIVVVKPQPPNP